MNLATPSSPLLRGAPELAAVALLDHAALVAAAALLAIHPGLADAADPGEPPTRRKARVVFAATERLRTALAQYEAAVRRDLSDVDDGAEDLPF